MSYSPEKAIDKAQKDKESLAAEYDVDVSQIVWTGDNKYIIAQGEREIYI